MTLFTIPMNIEVVAKSETEAIDLLCTIFDREFVYGCGLSECTAHDRAPGDEVTRVFDYEFKDDDEPMSEEEELAIVNGWLDGERYACDLAEDE